MGLYLSNGNSKFKSLYSMVLGWGVLRKHIRDSLLIILISYLGAVNIIIGCLFDCLSVKYEIF